MFGFGFKLAPGLMKIDLLGAEGQRDAAGSKRDSIHTKYSRIELAGGADILNRHYEVVDTIDLHGCTDLGGQGLTKQANRRPGSGAKRRTPDVRVERRARPHLAQQWPDLSIQFDCHPDR